jgi:hypothetical protein
MPRVDEFHLRAALSAARDLRRKNYRLRSTKLAEALKEQQMNPGSGKSSSGHSRRIVVVTSMSLRRCASRIKPR